MFGRSGKSSDPSEEEYYNDLHVLNTNTFVWEKISTTGVSPISRDSHTLRTVSLSWVARTVKQWHGGGKDDWCRADAKSRAHNNQPWKRLVFGRLRIPLVPGLLHVSPLQEILWTQSEAYYSSMRDVTKSLKLWMTCISSTQMLREKDPSEPKLSMRKELKRRRQEYRATPFMLDKQRDVDKSLVSSHGGICGKPWTSPIFPCQTHATEFQAHVQPLGEKMFEAREGKHHRRKPQDVQKTVPEQLLDDAYYAVKKLVAWLGSDWPVVAVNPVGGIRTAMERTPSGWSHPWIPKERISAWDAVAGYTSSAVYAAALEDLVGSLMQGKFADFVVLSESPFGQGTGIFPRVHICKKIGEEKAARIIKQLDLKLDNILSKLKKKVRESGDQHL
ncbi:hypothetical protein SELMODRAFT_427827 [Selaginella moellendorffii]|uniref:Amidohydrolase 3 domain-containing protein n=1 Tax=Selaginella moellendorffii TaxID=88036 RepID=D8T0U4_SELML|nr:hypothetical protein SELMODRAFT_427827 [Selaginella moellendorffii]